MPPLSAGTVLLFTTQTRRDEFEIGRGCGVFRPKISPPPSSAGIDLDETSSNEDLVFNHWYNFLFYSISNLQIESNVHLLKPKITSKKLQYSIKKDALRNAPSQVVGFGMIDDLKEVNMQSKVSTDWFAIRVTVTY